MGVEWKSRLTWYMEGYVPKEGAQPRIKINNASLFDKEYFHRNDVQAKAMSLSEMYGARVLYEQMFAPSPWSTVVAQASSASNITYTTVTPQDIWWIPNDEI